MGTVENRLVRFGGPNFVIVPSRSVNVRASNALGLQLNVIQFVYPSTAFDFNIILALVKLLT